MVKVVNTSGKRKTAIARASVKKGKGRVRINSVPLELLTPDLAREKIMEPLRIAGKKAEKLDIDVNVEGGGFMGQAYATRTAIAKGIVAYTSDEKLEAIYKEYDRSLLVSDPRRKMPKKPLGRGARKRRQKSYR
ncbi:MAG: 30S ribosomal protein S9 [Candidatus Proteinoplasmatales archaeon SG8-5]|nr:MAG: 30S ribosomal protein S9 [Candidatus Proteinoplasmatales archaeon SG8-5]